MNAVSSNLKADSILEYFVEFSKCLYENSFRKLAKILGDKMSQLGLSMCDSCNLISYRDKNMVIWNRSGIMLVTSVLITIIMMGIAIFEGFPAPMGCAPKTCSTVFSHANDCLKIHVLHNVDDGDKIVTISPWMNSGLHLLRDRL